VRWSGRRTTALPILPYVGNERIIEARHKSRSTLDSIAEFSGEFPHAMNTITRKAHIVDGE
jgi:hypothetical protein